MNKKAELIDYRRLVDVADKPYWPIGMGLAKIKHKTTTHYVEFDYNKNQIEADGVPDLSKIDLLGNIGFSLSSYISGCAQFLRNSEHLSKDTEVLTTMEDGYEVVIMNWDKDVEKTTYQELVQPFSNQPGKFRNLISNNMDLFYYLHDVLKALECRNLEFSETWFNAKILSLYLEDNCISSNTAFTIGILVQQMEYKSNTENILVKIIETREKSGKRGGEKSYRAKINRLNSFMDEIETLGDLYPRMSEESIVNQAFGNVVKKDPDLWRQGKGQRDEYLSNHIRSEEPYKARYYAIFGKTA